MTIGVALKADTVHLADFGDDREGAHVNVLQMKERVKTSFQSLCCFSVSELRANHGQHRSWWPFPSSA